MDGVFDWISSNLFVSLLLIFVAWICVAFRIYTGRMKLIEKLRKIPREQLYQDPTSYGYDLKSETLVLLHDSSDFVSLSQIRTALCHPQIPEKTWHDTLEQLVRVQFLVAEQSSDASPAYRITPAGKQAVLADIPSKKQQERADREYLKVSEVLLAHIPKQYDALVWKELVKRKPSAQEICNLVFAHFSGVKDCFLNSYVKPLIEEHGEISKIENAWLAIQFKARWAFEFDRARNYAITLCEHANHFAYVTSGAISEFDVKAKQLKDSIWNDAMLLTLEAGDYHHSKLVQNNDNAEDREELELATNMQAADRNRIVRIMATLAAYGGVSDTKLFFRELVNSADLPDDLKLSAQGIPCGDSKIDAGRLIDFAYARGSNPKDARFTVLGAVLNALLESGNPGLEQQRSIVAIIYKNHLVRGSALEDLRLRYGIPQPAEDIVSNADSGGVWLGPVPDDGDKELQSLLPDPPSYYEVDFLEHCMESSSSVCRIELRSGQALGTGFLVASDKLLTSFHVLGDHIKDFEAHEVLFRFRKTKPSGASTLGQLFRTAGKDSLLAHSPIRELDFALLQIEASIQSAPDIQKCLLAPITPLRKSALNIIQHPGGGVMRVAFSKDGVRWVDSERGLVQYVTRAERGSSGSPCFNDEWKVVAVHNCGISRSFGSIREGILVSKLYPRIEPFLDK